MVHRKNLSITEEIVPDGAQQRSYVDIHCHCLPGVDDGPATEGEALALCRALVDDGIGTVIATPHQLGRFSDCNEAAEVRQAVFRLNEQLQGNGIALTVAAGAEVRVDERILELLTDDKILTLADGGKYILLELPHEVFIDIEPLLVELATLQIQAIISHPERHNVLAAQPAILSSWQRRSAHLHVTAGSLLGEFGLGARKAAWRFLRMGWVSLVATDSHNAKYRRPLMTAAFKRISLELGQPAARLLCIDNPVRVLKGQDLLQPCSINTGKYSDERIASTF